MNRHMTPVFFVFFLLNHHTPIIFLEKSPCIMDASGFGHSNNENVSPNIDRYDHDTAEPILNLLSTSHSRVHTENERTHKPLDRSCAFTLQLSNLKLSKRLDKSNSVSEPHAPLLPLQPQRRLFSQVPLRLSAPYLSASTRKPSPFPAASHVVSLHKTTDDTSDRTCLDLFFFRTSVTNICFRCFFSLFYIA